MALADRAAACSLDAWVFFDRGMIDAAAALHHLTGEPALATRGQANRYHRRVFLTPPAATEERNDFCGAL
jgi:predicted ATPase